MPEVVPAVTPGLLMRCIEEGLPTLVDKPAGTAARHLALPAARDTERGTTVTVAYNRRYATHVRHARDLIRAHPDTFVSGECRWAAPFAERYSSDETYRSGCRFGDGVILDTASHIFDLLNFLGLSPLYVRSCSLRTEPGRPSGADISADLLLDGDRARIMVAIANGDTDDEWEITLQAPWGMVRLTRDALTGTADDEVVSVIGHDIHRPVVDLYCPVDQRCGATLTEAAAALRLVDRARARAVSQGRWIRPRAKALGPEALRQILNQRNVP